MVNTKLSLRYCQIKNSKIEVIDRVLWARVEIFFFAPLRIKKKAAGIQPASGYRGGLRDLWNRPQLNDLIYEIKVVGLLCVCFLPVI